MLLRELDVAQTENAGHVTVGGEGRSETGQRLVVWAMWEASGFSHADSSARSGRRALSYADPFTNTDTPPGDDAVACIHAGPSLGPYSNRGDKSCETRDCLR